MALPRIQPDKPIFEAFPKVFKKKGRVQGFEDLRDTLLANWETMMNKGMNAYSIIKLVIETDRHAMFAEVQADKRKAQFDQKVWEEFQDYLQGGVAPADDQVKADAETTQLAELSREGGLDEDAPDGEDEE